MAAVIRERSIATAHFAIYLIKELLPSVVKALRLLGTISITACEGGFIVFTLLYFLLNIYCLFKIVSEIVVRAWLVC